MNEEQATGEYRSHYPEQYVEQSKAPSQDPVAYVLHEGFTALCKHLAELTEAIARGVATTKAGPGCDSSTTSGSRRAAGGPE